MSQRGSYQTRQQEAVAALFARKPDACMTAEEAFMALVSEGMDVGKTTVYRAITKLCASGELRRYAAQDSGDAARYQHNPCRESHLHIRCVYCGALEHLHCEEVEAFAEHISRRHGFTLDEGQTVLCGVCDHCREARMKDK